MGYTIQVGNKVLLPSKKRQKAKIMQLLNDYTIEIGALIVSVDDKEEELNAQRNIQRIKAKLIKAITELPEEVYWRDKE